MRQRKVRKVCSALKGPRIHAIKTSSERKDHKTIGDRELYIHSPLFTFKTKSTSTPSIILDAFWCRCRAHFDMREAGRATYCDFRSKRAFVRRDRISNLMLGTSLNNKFYCSCFSKKIFVLTKNKNI